ncbi:MAG: hypothetical protein Q8P31_10640 [Bacillota bacterium]|nr:hypothetical protein [Bacillota bacterium]
MTTAKNIQDRGGSGGAGLLVSILLRFPEVGSVTFDPQSHALCFTLLLRQRMALGSFRTLQNLVLESVEAFSFLQGIEPRLVDVTRTSLQGLTAIEISRDAETLTREEISLLIGLMRSNFGDVLVVESDSGLMEEDLIVQEQLIDEALDDLRETQQQHNLIAYREGGRVLVFNK